MATDPRYIAKWRNELSRIDANTGANRPVQLCRGASTDSRMHVLSLVSTDTSPNSVRLFIGQALTKIGAATGALNFGDSATTVTRATGSFLTDGWRVGDEVIVPAIRAAAGPVTPGTVAIISAVEATKLTFTAAHGVAAASYTVALTPDLELFRGIQLGVSALVANQGNVGGSNVSLDLLTDTKPFVDSSPDRFLVLGPNDALFLTCVTALTGVETIETLAALGDY